MKGLQFFRKTSDPKSWCMASFHSPHSLTWRWALSFTLFKGGEAKVWPMFWSYRDNNGLQWGMRMPFIGLLRWSVQRPMWYRDLYHDKRDEIDGLKADAHKRRALAAVPRSVGVVADGGESLH